MATLPDLADEAAARWPDRVAWQFGRHGPQVTFAEAGKITCAAAVTLRALGADPGYRVAVMAGNQLGYIAAWLGCARAGATMVPLSVQLRAADLGRQLSIAAPHLVLYDSDRSAVAVTDAAIAQHLPQFPVLPLATLDSLATGTLHDTVEAEAPVSAMFTSGTTGPPKLALQNHRYWEHVASSIAAESPGLDPGDTVVTAQPMHYMDVWWQIAAGLVSGAKLVILDGFHPSAFAGQLRSYGATWAYVMGAMPALMLRQEPSPADRDTRLRSVLCSGIPAGLHAQLEDRWGVPWHEDYGLTEAAAVTRVTAGHPGLTGSGCVGAPVAGRQVRIAGGEILIAGDGLFSGYFGAPSSWDGPWWRTGDLGRLDGDGRLWLTGRSKDMIRRGGENISAWEVEQVLLAHPRVRQAAVTAEPDDLYGEVPMAYVATAVPAAELAGWCSERLAAFKVPVWWLVSASLPMTSSHRVAKTELGAVTGQVTGAGGGPRQQSRAASAR
jgi:carnitine-CoA ligase